MKILFILCMLIPNYAFSGCGAWQVEILNKTTKESKTFAYSIGESGKLPIKEKAFECEFSVNKTDSGSAAALLCTHGSFVMTSGASCFKNYSTSGLNVVSFIDPKTGNISYYNVTFSQKP